MIRIFIACSPSEWLPAKVLEFSIRESTQAKVQVLRLYESEIDIPEPKARRNKPRTPFSFQRFLIPQLCNHEGRAIYLDADMQVFQDIAGLWSHPMNDHDLLSVRNDPDSNRPKQFSVMLLDCAQLNWDIRQIVRQLDEGLLSYASLMFEMSIANNIGWTIDNKWNSLERYIPGETSLLHYTNMHTQPWISPKNPLRYLWAEALREALCSGKIKRQEIIDDVEKGHIRPSLLWEIGRIKFSEKEFLQEAKILDKNFVAPFRMIRRWPVLSQWIYSLKSLIIRQ